MGLEHYKVKSLKSVVERDLPNLQKTIRLRIQKAIKERLTVDPINLGEPLHHNLKGHRRLRVGEYRIIYRVNQLEQIVTIVFSKMDDKVPLWYYQPKAVSLYIYT